jgi:hypothetical protein
MLIGTLYIEGEDKVDVPNAVTYPNMTPIFERYVVNYGSMNRD